MVNNTIQGHPESPRLWEKLIDSILWNIGLSPTKHEPCLYQGNINEQYTLFLWQVDDIAIAMLDEAHANDVLRCINQHLKLPIHSLGLVTMFNAYAKRNTTLKSMQPHT
jgi:hypothetical protein